MIKEIKKIADMLDSNKEISQWSIKGVRQREHQLFSSGLSAEERRTVISWLLTVNIHMIQGKLQGISSFVIAPHEISELSFRIEKALKFCRMLRENRLYFLPSPEKYPQVTTLDRDLKKDADGNAAILFERTKKAFARKKMQKLATSEFFITLGENYFLNSLGAEGYFEDSRVFLDFVITAKSAHAEAESHADIAVRTLKALDIEMLLEYYMRNATDKLSAGLPPTGTFPVVIEKDALVSLFDPLIFHSSGKAFDMGISSFRKGETVCRGKPVRGEGITLHSEPKIPYGLKTFPFDKDGVPARTVKIIENGVFKRLWATKEFADYLKMAPTGEFGNLEVRGGAYASEALMCDEKPLLHILEFSFLYPDAPSGNFVDEIRLGYLREKERITPIKGGSVSGNIFDALASSYFSSEIYSAGYYQGPEAVKFSELSISGK